LFDLRRVGFHFSEVIANARVHFDVIVDQTAQQLSGTGICLF
jgi:hypothetical protein